MAPVPLAARVVEVIADLGEATSPRYRYGSGCVVVGATVLTAAHVVAGARTVVVRGPDKVLRPASVDPRFVGDVDGPGPDLALVFVDGGGDHAAMRLGMVNRGSVNADPVERCQAIGYPGFMERSTAGAAHAFRDTVDAFGHVPVLSNLASGLLSLVVVGAPRPLPPESASLGESEWAGMSGGPVVTGGFLLGVVTEHAPREGPATITFTSLTALEANPEYPKWGVGVPDPAAWWKRLGVTGLAELERLPRRPEPAYKATVRTIQKRTPELRGRERELGEIAAFAGSSEAYRWLTGGPWTGKTALLAASIAQLPGDLQIVAYFLSRRETDADSNRFLAAVVPQLADLLEREPPQAIFDEFLGLWRDASERATAEGRHLLLVVDGLDEDLCPDGSPSVAARLPAAAGGCAHVLVSSRPHFELPSDVETDHPLWSTPRTRIAPLEGAERLAMLARQEIDELKGRCDDDELATEVLGFLTAAAGPLAIADVAALTSDREAPPHRHTRAVRRLLAGARSLEAVGPTDHVRHQFAHASLLEYARTDPDLTDPYFRERLDAWADQWATAGWLPSDESTTATPRYLLDEYPARLAGSSRESDRERLAQLVGDIRWVDTAVAQVGLDTVLSSLRTAAQLPAAPASVHTMLRVLEQQSHHFRQAAAGVAVGYAATMVGWRALALGDDELAGAAAERLRALPPPQLVPEWSTERIGSQPMCEFGGHDGHVDGLAATDDGLIVSGGQDGVLRIWDPRRPGSLGRQLGDHGEPISALVVTDGGLVVSSGLRSLRLWNPHAAEVSRGELGRVDGHLKQLVAARHGLVISGEEDGTVRLWDTRDPGTPAGALREPGGLLFALAVGPNGRVVTGGVIDDDPRWGLHPPGGSQLWDLRAPGTPSSELGELPEPVLAAAITGEGRVVFAVAGELSIWDPRGDRPAAPLGAHGHQVRALAVTTGGLIVSGGDDGAVRTWNPQAPDDPGRDLGRHDGAVLRLTVTPAGLVVSSGDDGTVRVWDPRAAAEPPRDRARGASALASGKVAVSCDGIMAAAAGDGAVWLWNRETPDGRVIGAIAPPVSDVAVTHDGRVLYTRGGVWEWNPHVENDPWREVPVADGAEILAIADNDAGLLVCGDDHGAVLLVDIRNPGDPVRELGRVAGHVVTLAISPEGLVAAGLPGLTKVVVWDTAKPKAPGHLVNTPVWFSALAVSDQPLVVCGGEQGEVWLYDPQAPDTAGRRIGLHDDEVAAVTLTSEGVVISGGKEGALRLWSPNADGDLGRQLCRHDGGVLAIDVADDGRVAVGTPAGITIFTLTRDQR